MTLTVDQVAKALPVTLKGVATQTFVDQINNIVSDPIVAEQVRNNFISYTGVLKDGKFKTEDYLHAVVYVSHKLMNQSNEEAYFRTFPQRHQALIAKGTSKKDISSYVSMYNKGKLVQAVMEQTMTPSWVLNQSLYQEALNVQADLMHNAVSEMVRTTAANSILTQLQKPKEVGPLLNIDMKETSGMVEMKAMLVDLARQQQAAIAAGVTTKDIAAQNIIEVEARDVS